jgi:methionine synthase II (cobalamin-independent)
MGAMQNLFGADGPNAYAFEQMQEALETMRTDPARFQQMMRDEFRALPVEQQEAFINALASTGMASRAWWERFLRGE